MSLEQFLLDSSKEKFTARIIKYKPNTDVEDLTNNICMFCEPMVMGHFMVGTNGEGWSLGIVDSINIIHKRKKEIWEIQSSAGYFEFQILNKPPEIVFKGDPSRKKDKSYKMTTRYLVNMLDEFLEKFNLPITEQKPPEKYLEPRELLAYIRNQFATRCKKENIEPRKPKAHTNNLILYKRDTDDIYKCN